MSSEVFIILMRTINFSSLRLYNFNQLLDSSSVIIGKIRVFESVLDNQREFALFLVVPEES